MSEFNFCEIPHEELMRLLDYLDAFDDDDIGSHEETYKEGKCIKKKWVGWSEIIVYPKEIKAKTHPLPTQTLLTEEKYIKMRNLFIKD